MRVTAQGPVKAGIKLINVPGSAMAIGMLVAKVTFAVKNGELVADREQLSLWDGDQTIGGRLFGNDYGYPKKNVDLVVVGDAIAPGGEPVERVNVKVSLGPIDRTLMVFGNRRWVRSDGKDEEPAPPLDLTDQASAVADAAGVGESVELPEFDPPEPPDEDDEDEDEDQSDEDDPTYEIGPTSKFTRLALDWRHAFGGDGFQDNPDGKGFIQYPTDEKEKPSVAGVPLPNVEDSARLITSWRNWPRPAGCGYYPSRWGMRLRRGIEPKGTKPPCILAAMFNQASPDFEMPDFPEGKTLNVTNMTPNGSFSARIRTPLVTATLDLPDLSPRPQELVWDLILARPEYNQVVLVGRTPFKFDPVSQAGQTARVVCAEPAVEGF